MDHLPCRRPSVMKECYRTIAPNMPILIESAGCAVDCKSLKRYVRLELKALECNFSSLSGSYNLGVQSVANLVQQVLYGRLRFALSPVWIILQWQFEGGSHLCLWCQASYKRVAVGCNGAGQALLQLQPILNRLFSESPRRKVIWDRVWKRKKTKLTT